MADRPAPSLDLAGGCARLINEAVDKRPPHKEAYQGGLTTSVARQRR